MTTEFKVGIFLAVGISFLLLLSTKVNDFSLFSNSGYELRVDMDDVLGIELNSKISANGLNVGYLKAMELNRDKVTLTIAIDAGVKIPNDSAIEIRQKSMLSGLVLVFNMGLSEEYYEDGDVIAEVLRFNSIDESADRVYDAANEFINLIYRLQGMINADTQKNIQESIENIAKMTGNLNGFLSAQQTSLTEFVKESNELLKLLKHTTSNVDASIPKMTARLESILNDIEKISKSAKDEIPPVLQNIKTMVEDTKEPLKKTLETVDKVSVKADDLLTDMGKTEVEISLNSQYYATQNDSKSVFELSISPDINKAYVFGLSSRDDYSYDSTTGQRKVPKQYDNAVYLLSAQLQYGVSDFNLRLGIMENTGGVGVDYFMFSKKLRASLDVYDFDAKNFYVANGNPNIRMGVRYNLFKYIDTYVGYENILNISEAGSFTFGLGFRTFDKDIKTVLSVVGASL